MESEVQNLPSEDLIDVISILTQSLYEAKKEKYSFEKIS